MSRRRFCDLLDTLGAMLLRVHGSAAQIASMVACLIKMRMCRSSVQSEVMHVPLSPIRCLYRGMDLFGKKVGVVCGERRFTYAEFGERCERLAAGLQARGIVAGDRVAYLSFNNHQLLEG
jgi:hypothetical protein